MKKRTFAPAIPLPDFAQADEPEQTAAPKLVLHGDKPEKAHDVIKAEIEAESGVVTSSGAESETDFPQPDEAHLLAAPREYVSPKENDVGYLDQIPVEKILPSPFQPRLYFNEQSIEDLAENIREVGGLVEPIKVRPLASGEYELVSGERRLRAYRVNGDATIPAWIKAMDDDSAFKEACAENLNREDLTLYEKAAAYKRALDEGRAKSQRALAVLSGANRMDIQRCLSIFKLPQAAIKIIAADGNIIGVSHIEPLVDHSENGHGDLVIEGLDLVSKGRLKRDMLISWIEKQAKPKSQIQAFHQYSLHGKPLGRMVIKSKKVSFSLDNEENSELLIQAFEKAIASLGATKG